MEMEKVLRGIERYLESKIYCNLASWQRVIARVAMDRFIGNPQKLEQNAIVSMIALNDDGMVALETLRDELKKQVCREGKVIISTPITGDITFFENDVDDLYNHIMMEA